jgi:serine/threonine protein kinase
MDGTLLIPGMLVAGKYELKGPLARGAMGEVWIATHATLGGEMAIKFLSRGPTHDGEDEATAMARFRFEAQVAAKLSRKTRHIAAVTDHGEEYGFAYLVMELIEGESLEKLMEREGKCSLSTLAPIVAQVAKGLSHAHADGVFHRDLKPANILLSRDEDGRVLVKILDFGIAKTVRSHKVTGAHEAGHATEIGIVLGTPNYMSPEQARGLATLDHRCDLWALSTIAYEALCGTLPYDGETTADLLVNICSVDPIPVSTHRTDLPASADEFFKKAFAASPAKRFQTAAELATAFEKLASEAAQPTQRLVSAPPPAPRRLELVEQRNESAAIDVVNYEPPRGRAGIFIVLGALAVAALIFVGLRMSRSDAKTTTAPTAEPTPTQTLSIPPPPLPPPNETSVASVEPAPPPPPKVTSKPIVGHKPVPTATTAAPTAAPSPTPTPKKPVDKGEIL